MKRTRRNPSLRTMSDSELDSTIRGLSASLPKSVVRDVARDCGWSAGFMLMPSRAEMESFASKLTVAHARRLASEIHEARTTKPGSDERREMMKWKAWQDSRTENPRRRANPALRWRMSNAHTGHPTYHASHTSGLLHFTITRSPDNLSGPTTYMLRRLGSASPQEWTSTFDRLADAKRTADAQHEQYAVHNRSPSGMQGHPMQWRGALENPRRRNPFPTQIGGSENIPEGHAVRHPGVKPMARIGADIPADVREAEAARSRFNAARYAAMPQAKRNPAGHRILYTTPGAGPAARVRAGNDGRFYVEHYTGAPMSSGWAMASDHGTLAAAIERAKDSAAAMRKARRNPRPSTLATRWATTPEKAPRGYVTDRVDAAGFPVFRKGEWSVDGTMMIRHEGQATGIPGQRDRHGWRASTWTAGRGWVDVGSLAATPADAATGAKRKNPMTSRMKAANYRKAARALDRMAANSERELSPTHATVLSIRAEAADWRRKADLLDKLGARKNPARRRKKTGAKRKAFQAQSILLDKDTFTLARARDWLKKNGKKYGKITEGDADWHAEQHPAGDYQPTRKGGYGGFHTIQLGKHVQAIVGIPKSGSDAADAAGYNTKGPGLFGNRKASGPATVAAYNADDVLY